MLMTQKNKSYEEAMHIVDDEVCEAKKALDQNILRFLETSKNRKNDMKIINLCKQFIDGSRIFHRTSPRYMKAPVTVKGIKINRLMQLILDGR